MHLCRTKYFAVFLCSLLLGGCTGGGSGADARQPVFKVKGKITMSGGAVANAMVSFSPKAKQPVATARTGTDGTYILTTYDAGDGAAAGDYVVLVTKQSASTASSPTLGGHVANKAPDGAAMHAAQAAGGGTGDGGSALPDKYGRVDQSDLKATVKSSNDNVLDFDLKP